jgi:glycosyltransferase involved in cell wall biosynthesis
MLEESGANQSAHEPKVAILLCTYHGQHFLRDQLDSIATQRHRNWEVWASDDGSKDDTRAILDSYQAKWGADKLSIHSGPADGFVANFLSLTCMESITAEYYAFSDQDDVWELDKLTRAVKWLESIPPDIPAIYCSRTRLVDANDREIGLSPLFSKPPSFANALMQNIGGGNTMVFNNATRDLLRMAGDDVKVITHDWWAYLVVAGCGGMVRYDPIPTLRYRQHDENLVGSNVDFAARLARIGMLWGGRFRELNSQHIAALERLSSRMTSESKATLKLFSESRDKSLIPRVIGFLRAGIYRQTVMGNLGLIAAAIFKKM